MANPNGNPQNLTAPRFQRGQKPPPRHRPKQVCYPSEWLRRLAGKPVRVLRRIVEHPERHSAIMVGAARQLVSAATNKRSRCATQSFSAICNRLEGLPRQTIDLTAQTAPTPDQLLGEIRRQISTGAAGRN